MNPAIMRTYAPVSHTVEAVRITEEDRFRILRWVSARGADGRWTGDGLVVHTPNHRFLVAWGEWLLSGPTGLHYMDDTEFRATYRET